MGKSNASKGAKKIDAFNEGKLDGVNVPGTRGENLWPGAKRTIMEQQEEYDRRKKEEEEKKNRDLLHRKSRKNKK